MTGKAILLAAVLLPPAGILWGQSRRDDGPRMEIEPEEHDFGSVRQDRTLIQEFTIRNPGTEVLEILRISTSCGCTAAVSSERTVAPGGTTTLEVTLETRKYSGVVERSVSVATNAPGRVYTVRVKAFVEPEG